MYKRQDDGLFEVTLIKRPKNPLELNEIIASLLMQEDHTDLIDSFKTDRIIIESNQEISWTLDGEYGGDHCYVCIEARKHAMEPVSYTHLDVYKRQELRIMMQKRCYL